MAALDLNPTLDHRVDARLRRRSTPPLGTAIEAARQRSLPSPNRHDGVSGEQRPNNAAGRVRELARPVELDHHNACSRRDPEVAGRVADLLRLVELEHPRTWQQARGEIVLTAER